MPVVSGRCVSTEGGVCTTQAGRWMDGWMNAGCKTLDARQGRSRLGHEIEEMEGTQPDDSSANKRDHQLDRREGKGRDRNEGGKGRAQALRRYQSGCD